MKIFAINRLLSDKCYFNNYFTAVILILFILLLPATMLRAQSSPGIIDWGADKMLNAYLMQQIHHQYALRNVRVQRAMQSVQGVKTYQQQLRASYQKLLGELPGNAPLYPTVTDTLRHNGYHIEKLIYQSFPQHHVTASLYIPEGKGPFPGVLLFCGHEAEAKATPSYQQTAVLFARQGFVVLMIDPVSQGERHQLTDSTGRPLTRGGTTEHTLLNMAAGLTGSSVAAYELWDNERGLDYLLSRKEVDTARIGCLGNSGGGTQAAYFMAFENRIKVAAVCSYITTRERTFELAGPLDGCVQIPNEGKYGLEITDYMHLFAPRPLLVLAGRYDFVDYTGAEQAYGEAKQCYTTLGAGEKVQLVTVDDGHGISKPKREAAVRWFRKWMYDDDKPVQEEAIAILPATALNCTGTGELNNSISGEITLQQYFLQTASSMATHRARFLQTVTPDAFRDTLRQLLGIPPLREKAEVEAIQEKERQPEKYLLRSKGEPPLPFILMRPPGSTAIRKVVIYLHDEGKRTLLDSSALLQYYLQKGDAVLLPDLRGMGETADGAAFNHPKFYNREYRNVTSSLHMGRPLIGQRVTDLLLLLDYLQSDPVFKQSVVSIKASGTTALVALHAAVIDQRIHHLEIDQYLDSFMSIIRRLTVKDQYSNVIPGVLRYYDVPDLLQMLNKRLAAVD
ncbi:acetylxylan esterase [Chitinophaga sp.]|uniref:acetylxylan esterase n=1 Tax=Chitinophaga sp. TaxID=1869181 RepID=UPI002B9A4A73|nr:acetylxylan esterase [Chitinophaga sp.]HWV66560.1 acetylxylan esterase [Chitinophaga sp.]